MLNIDKSLLFFDTETTGIIKNKKWEIISNWDLIQIAYRELKLWEKADNNLFFNTDTKIQIWAIAVHNIYPELLIEKSGWNYLTDNDREDLGALFSENILIAHNLDFDLDVLDKSWIEYWTQLIDTLKISKLMKSEGVLLGSDWNLPEYVNLQYLRFFFELYQIKDSDWNIENTTAHDAFWDVVVLENVFYKLFEVIKEKLNISDNEVIETMIEMTKKEFSLIEVMRIWKYRWKTFEEVSKIDRWYLEWMCNADFTEDIKYTCSVWLGREEDKKFFS